MSVKKQNLDAHLAEVLKQNILIKDEDLSQSQQVFNGVFEQVKKAMDEQCPYFKKYSSQSAYAGSVYDGIKVSKMDEFDMNIVIRLPIRYDDGDDGIIIEDEMPGYVRLKIGNAFDYLDKQQNWENCHKVTRDWRDKNNYLLQSKFRYWMHSIVQKAVNALGGKVTVDDVAYLVTYKESGPAFNLKVRNDVGTDKFKLDVDLVPVIRFLLPRWPKGYRQMENPAGKSWLVVPKPVKTMPDTIKNRCWRLSFHEYEKDLMKKCEQLKNTIRLVKKLRDTLGMKEIASYYIKTLFLWKLDETDKKIWQTKPSVTFRMMLQELHDAIKNKDIPFFWQKENNLIQHLKPSLQQLYVKQLREVLDSIDNNHVDKVLKSLLTTNELAEFRESEFCQKKILTQKIVDTNNEECKHATKNGNTSPNSQSSEKGLNMRMLSDKIDALNEHMARQMNALFAKMEDMQDKLEIQNDRLRKLEMKVDVDNKGLLQAVGAEVVHVTRGIESLQSDLERQQEDRQIFKLQF